jgi:hypothetical protein
VARPWPKRSAWPYISKKGRKSYIVGFYDHDKRERSRSFPSAAHARAWMRDYSTAERRGSESLRRFLLDLDARQANEAQGAIDCPRTLADVLDLYLCLDADPVHQSGLAPSTYERYRSLIGRHLVGNKPHGSSQTAAPYALALGRAPAARFNEPTLPRQWREQMIRAGVPKPTRNGAWRVLSAALSWAAASNQVPEIKVNGCRLAGEHPGSRRRSARAGGTGYAPSSHDHRLLTPSWALPPLAVEAIRHQMLSSSKARGLLLTHRDSMIVGLQYGLCLRNQELWALRWASVVDGFVWVLEALSSGRLIQWGKTANSIQRRTVLPPLLAGDLAIWRELLLDRGHSVSKQDFIIPGDLAGASYGTRDPRTHASHFSANQAMTWGRKHFALAVRQVSERPGFGEIRGATPYALRRGGISLRLRAEDPQTVANECGTSLAMLSKHYAFAIQDLRHHRPRPVEVEWRAARQQVMLPS